MSYENNVEMNLTPAEKWERVRITNSFLFYKIMTSNPEECRRLNEILLEKPVEKIEYASGEHVIDIDWDAKGIRLDVYVKGTNTEAAVCHLHLPDRHFRERNAGVSF